MLGNKNVSNFIVLLILKYLCRFYQDSIYLKIATSKYVAPFSNKFIVFTQVGIKTLSQLSKCLLKSSFKISFNVPEIYHGVLQVLDCVFYNLSSICYPSNINKLALLWQYFAVYILICISFASIHLQIFRCIGFIVSSSYNMLYHSIIMRHK